MKNKIIKKVSAVLLAGVMTMGLSVTAFAKTGTPTIGQADLDQTAKASITKNLELAEGLAVPNETFHFNIVKVTGDAPTAVIKDITYNQDDQKGPSDNGKYTISKTSQIEFGEFPHAGQYEYKVTETAGQNNKITYSKDEFYLRVQVVNANNGKIYIKTITAEKGTETGVQENKVAKILFTNVYRDNGSLTIEKKTEGKLADKTKAFKFTVKLEKSPTATEVNPTYQGEIGTRRVDVQPGIEKDFELKDGEKLVFNNLPAGTKYIVKEKGVQDGYTPSVKVIANGVERNAVGTEAEDLVTSQEGDYVGQNENKVTFINTYNDVPITGIIMNNLPFILLIVVAGTAFVALAVLKRRKTSGR